MKSSMHSRRQLRVHTTLSLTLSGTEVLKKVTEELPELRTGGGFHFCIYIGALFLLKISIFGDSYAFFSDSYALFFKLVFLFFYSY